MEVANKDLEILWACNVIIFWFNNKKCNYLFIFRSSKSGGERGVPDGKEADIQNMPQGIDIRQP